MILSLLMVVDSTTKTRRHQHDRRSFHPYNTFSPSLDRYSATKKKRLEFLFSVLLPCFSLGIYELYPYLVCRVATLEFLTPKRKQTVCRFLHDFQITSSPTTSCSPCSLATVFEMTTHKKRKHFDLGPHHGLLTMGSSIEVHRTISELCFDFCDSRGIQH